MAAKKNVRRTDGSSQRAESQRQGQMRKPVPVDRMASERRAAAQMAVKPMGPTAAFVVPGQQATGLSPGRPMVKPTSNVPVVNMNSVGGRFSLRGGQGPIHPDSFGVIAGSAAGIPMGVASAIPYSAGARAVKNVVGNVTKPVANKVLNTIRGEAVGLHGSPTTGITRVNPHISRTDVDIPTVSIMRTDMPRHLRELRDPSLVEPYAGPTGSVYVVKVDKKTTSLPKFPKGPWTGDPTAYTKSTSPAKVFAEVRMQDFPMMHEYRAELARQVRMAGSSLSTSQKTMKELMSEAKTKVKFPKRGLR